MDTVETIWQELNQASGCRSSGGRSPLSSFQIPKRRTKCPMQPKIFNIYRTLGVSSQKTSNSLPIQEGFEERGAEGGSASAHENKRIYKVDSWQFVASTVQRQVNTLKEECNNAKRYNALETLKDIFVDAAVPNIFYDRAFPLLLDPFLLCLSEPSEAARYMAACLLLKFLTEVAEVDAVLGDVLRGLVSRFGSRDIEGVAHLPPIMRPTPEYKPLQLVPVEKSEEVRRTLLQVLQTVLNRTSDKSTWDHLDLITGLIRATTMDLCHEIKFAALQILVDFFDRHQSMLLHFTEPVARSILSCLVHQHARIRMGALRALTHVLACGLYKYNGDIIQMLAGWRDPNIVPIKALYEPTTVRNYFAELLADQSPMVRMFFFDTVARWLFEFKDKADYETWLFPYLLSGLFDSFRPIQQLVFRLLELLGKQYEDTHEKDLRDIKQLGTPEPWSYGGRACLTFPLGGYWDAAEGSKALEEREQFVSFVATYTERLHSLGFDGYSLSEAQTERFATAGDALVGDPPRPCLGTRMMVRTYFRRYANTLFQHVEDFKEVTMAASARLMAISLAFIEEACVEWLDSILTICCRVLPVSHHMCLEAVEAYKVAVRLVGAFVDPEIYWDFVKGALEQSSLEEAHDRVAKVGLLALMLEGSFAVLQKASGSTLGLGRLKPVLPKIAEALYYTELLQEEYISFSAESVTKVLQVLIPAAVRQQEKLSLTTWHHLLGVICSLASPDSTELETANNTPLAPHLQDLLDNLAICNGFASNGFSAQKEVGNLWHLVEISDGFMPTNLAALNTYVRYLPCTRIREERTFELIFAKLQELSAATQKAATRRGARRTALRLIKRLILETPLNGQLNDIHESTSSDQTTEINYEPPALKGCFKLDNSAMQEATEVLSNAKGPDKLVKMSEVQDQLMKSPIQAAAKILTGILLNKLSQLDFLDDLEDTLVALTEFLTLPLSASCTIPASLQETLETSGFVTALGQFLQDPSLHRRLFCLACEAYAHECATKYPDKQPATVLEDLPLGKRRELRLSSIRAAAALKEHAVLLMKVSLPVAAKSVGSLRCLVNSLIESLHPANKLQKRHAVRMGENCHASWSKTCSCEAEMSLVDTSDQLGGEKCAAADETTGKRENQGAVQCTSSLPFQPQSHWLLFQIASCLWDAINMAISCNVDLDNRDAGTDKRPASCQCQSLIMPRVWHFPAHSHLQLERAGRFLLELCTESELSGAIDSCVRQIVELQGPMQSDSKLSTEKFEKDSRRCWEANPNLGQAVTMAKKQINTVPAEMQKEQAVLALIHLVRLLGSVCPSAIKECIMQYDSRGRFSRREVLTQLLNDPTATSCGFTK